MSSIGIDFGTTNSVLAVFASDGPEAIAIDTPPDEWAVLGFDKVLPSVYGLSDGTPVVGWAAKILEDRQKAEAVKRLFAKADEMTIAGERVLVEEVATHLFASIRKGAAAAGVSVTSAVVTVPANSRDLPRFRTKVCAGMAGIEVMALLNEPTAAAMAFGSRVRASQNVLVVDWGGGTLDVTLLAIEDGVFMEQASKGIQELGGIDFDRAIYNNVTKDVSRDWSAAEDARFRLNIEQAKIGLSTQDQVVLTFPNGMSKSITRRLLTEWVGHLIRRVEDPIRRCLGDLRLSSADVDALLLVGGTCKMPSVADVVAETVGKDPVSDIDPMTAVAEGAAVAAAILNGEKKDADFFVSTEHALGTVVLDSNTAALKFSPIIPRNHKLPASASESYVPVNDFQESIELSVVEGDPTRPLDDEENVVLRTFEVPIPPRPMSESRFVVTYEYDTNGILHVKVVHGDSDETVFAGDVSYVAGISPEELVGIARRVEQTASTLGGLPTNTATDSLPPDALESLQQAREKVIPYVDDEEAEKIARLASALEMADTGDALVAAKTELDEVLRKYSYLF